MGSMLIFCIIKKKEEKKTPKLKQNAYNRISNEFNSLSSEKDKDKPR